MTDFDDSQLLELVDIHKECYPTASASTRSQVLKQLKSGNYGTGTIAYSMVQIYKMKQKLDQKEKELNQKEEESEQFWNKRDEEQNERDEEQHKAWSSIAKANEDITRNRAYNEEVRRTSETLRGIVRDIRRKALDDWCSSNEWEIWIHDKYTDKEISQLGL